MYTDEYTDSDFRALWKGREERCPYWNDEVWFSPLDEERIDDRARFLCHHSWLPPGECLNYNIDCFDDFGEIKPNSRRIYDDHEEKEAEGEEEEAEGEEEEAEGEEEEAEEEKDAEERKNGNVEYLEDQEGQMDWSWEPSSPSREWVLEGVPFSASFLDAEPERPYALSHGTREATSLDPDGAAQMSSWSSTTLYCSILRNPWVDHDSEG